MGRTITSEQAAIIKSTVPVLAAHGETVTSKFYDDMIEENPSLKNIFNSTHQKTGHQASALAGALYAYAANIDSLGKLGPAVELIANKHASLYIKPEHYEIVGEYLLKTLKTVLGDAATPAIMDAWGAAYWQLADIFIAKEKSLYDATPYWSDWKDFKIARKEKESDEITSFYLEPADPSFKLPLFKPGQYISINLFVKELEGGVWQARQYSLSDAPGKPYLRISVKREKGVELGNEKHLTHPGYLSNILHDSKSVGDVVRISHPWGEFFFDNKEGDDSPVVLISAGVGLTALTSILNTLAEQGSRRPISWIHGARTEKVMAFRSHVDELAENKNIRRFFFTSEPSGQESQGKDYDIRGRVDLDKVGNEQLHTNNDKTQYFICGPTQFMLDIEHRLKSFGVPAERVHVELFGTGGVPRVS